MADLFGTSDEKQDGGSSAARPLADRLRPAKLEEVVGQEHLTGADGALTRMIASGSLGSLSALRPSTVLA